MPVDSKYTDDVIKFLRERTGRGEPVTAPEIADATGMSRQNAYMWVESNAWRLREVGKGRHNARAYVLTGDMPDGPQSTGGGRATDSGTIPSTITPSQLPSTFKPTGSWQVKARSRRRAPASTEVARARLGGNTPQIGMVLTVVALRLEGNGDLVLELQGDGDVRLTVTIAQ